MEDLLLGGHRSEKGKKSNKVVTVNKGRSALLPRKKQSHSEETHLTGSVDDGIAHVA